MNRFAAVAAAVLLALTLTGCGEDTTDAQPRAFAATGQESPTPDAADAPPLVAESPKAVIDDNKEEAFLLEVRARLARIQSQIPNATDEQLLAVGHAACDRIAAGESGEHWSGIEGETETNGYYMDSGAISIAAAMTICPSDA